MSGHMEYKSGFRLYFSDRCDLCRQEWPENYVRVGADYSSRELRKAASLFGHEWNGWKGVDFHPDRDKQTVILEWTPGGRPPREEIEALVAALRSADDVEGLDYQYDHKPDLDDWVARSIPPAPLARRLKALVTNPGGWGCRRCRVGWGDYNWHLTPYRPGHACFVLCDECWPELSPEDRLPAYADLCLNIWKRDEHWPQIKAAVLAGE